MFRRFDAIESRNDTALAVINADLKRLLHLLPEALLGSILSTEIVKGTSMSQC
jgi:hypothetical protein